MQLEKLAAWPRFGAGTVPVKDHYRDNTGVERINSYEGEARKTATTPSVSRTTELTAERCHFPSCELSPGLDLVNAWLGFGHYLPGDLPCGMDAAAPSGVSINATGHPAVLLHTG